MEKAPCECMIWNGLPVIKKEITKCIINEFGLTQRKTAELLGVTPACICQYMSNKRGRAKLPDKILKIEINVSAKRIIKNGESAVVPEVCRICKIIKSNGGTIFNIEK